MMTCLCFFCDMHAHIFIVTTTIMSAYNPLLDTNMIGIIRSFLLGQEPPLDCDHFFRFYDFEGGIARCRLRSISRAWYKAVPAWRIHEACQLHLTLQKHQVIIQYEDVIRKLSYYTIIRNIDTVPRVILDRVTTMHIYGSSPHAALSSSKFIETAISFIASCPVKTLILDCVPITTRWKVLQIHPLTSKVHVTNGYYNTSLHVIPAGDRTFSNLIQPPPFGICVHEVKPDTEDNFDFFPTRLVRDSILCPNRQQIDKLIVGFLCTRMRPITS